MSDRDEPAGLKILVTGATGYIGGRLVPRLLEAGHSVRCLSRDPQKLRDVPWAGEVDITRGDASDAASLETALDGVAVAYYLIHSIGAGDGSFESKDRVAAQNFAAAAKAAGIERIVYLGGLTPLNGAQALSEHLRSRDEVGRIFLESGVPTAVLRAAVIIGSGGASFEMLRYLTERLPAMVTPTWVQTRIQPIAVRDVLRYLIAAATLPSEVSRAFDIGGPDVLTYEQMMQRYANVAGLRHRLIVRVPLLSPRLSSHWVNVVTPVPRAIARPLIDSLRNEVVCDEHDIAQWIPDPPEGLLGVDDAIRLALQKVREASVETRWSSVTWPGAPSDPLPTDPDWAGGSLYLDTRELAVDAPAAQIWRVIEGIGGEHGWYSWPLAWAVRGWVDRIVGGVGLRRGRRDPNRLQIGESLDWWRVEEVEPGTLLRLRAEMKVPGTAWLEFHVRPATTGGDGDKAAKPVLVQRAIFHPHGLAGQAYWWSVKPFHGVVFGGMLRNIAHAAEREAGTAPSVGERDA